VAIQRGLLTVEKQGKKNVFAGRIMEIEGLPNLKVEQAFEFTDASAERNCAACTIKLSVESVAEYLRSNVVLLKNMIARGYQDARTLLRRIAKMEAWLANPTLLEADPDAEYAAVIEIDLNTITEPIVCAPNDPDKVMTLSEVHAQHAAGNPDTPIHIDEVFIGSCMTNIGHYRAAAKILEGEGRVKVRQLWICPPTRMDEAQLRAEGVYSIFAAAGARTEMPGCSLCMGNQARVADGATVMSTSTRNFDNRMGRGARVYLGSAELAAVCALLGRIPTVEEYRQIVATKIQPFAGEVYRYLNFHEIPGFEDEGRVIPREQMPKLEEAVGIQS
jgi:aconitate hydratase 2/2-methylisocitrate dehydratase